MPIKFTDTQLLLLGAASRRNDNCLVPPTGPKRSRAQRAGGTLLKAGFVKEIRAKAGAPIWRRDQSGQAFALKVTAAGVKAVAADETGPSRGETERRAGDRVVSVDRKPELSSDPAGAIESPNGDSCSTLTSPRVGTKIARVIELLQRGGATLAELGAVTAWLPHTTRAALTGLRKRSYAITIDRSDRGRGSVYRIEPADAGEVSVAPVSDARPRGEAPSDQPEPAASLRARRAA